MESSIEQTNTLRQFTSTMTLEIPQDILQRFIHNFDHKDEMWNSVKAYDEWFKQYYSQYKKFIQGLKRELVEIIDYQFVVGPAGTAR